VAVLIAGQPVPEHIRAITVGADEAHRRNAALSSNSVFVTAPASGHMMQLDAPDTVIEAVRRVHVAARNGTRLSTLAQAAAVASSSRQ
jgi:hypothetical protein